MRKHRNNTNPLVALAVAALVAVAGCTDDPMVPEEDHAEPEGAVLTLTGVDLIIATYDGDTQTWTPAEYEWCVGQETPHIGVTFVDHDGDAVPLDDDFYLEVDVEDESIAKFEQDTPGEFGGHLHGEAEGHTDVAFSLMHGAVGSGHPDFTTAGLHVDIEECPSS